MAAALSERPILMEVILIKKRIINQLEILSVWKKYGLYTFGIFLSSLVAVISTLWRHNLWKFQKWLLTFLLLSFTFFHFLTFYLNFVRQLHLTYIWNTGSIYCEFMSKWPLLVLFLCRWRNKGRRKGPELDYGQAKNKKKHWGVIRTGVKGADNVNRHFLPKIVVSGRYRHIRLVTNSLVLLRRAL